MNHGAGGWDEQCQRDCPVLAKHRNRLTAERDARSSSWVGLGPTSAQWMTFRRAKPDHLLDNDKIVGELGNRVRGENRAGFGSIRPSPTTYWHVGRAASVIGAERPSPVFRVSPNHPARLTIPPIAGKFDSFLRRILFSWPKVDNVLFWRRQEGAVLIGIAFS